MGEGGGGAITTGAAPASATEGALAAGGASLTLATGGVAGGADAGTGGGSQAKAPQRTNGATALTCIIGE